MKLVGGSVIFELRDLIGPADCQAGLPDGRYVRSVGCPFYDGLLARIRSAWEVVQGRAYPVRWPEPGELEDALASRIERRNV